MTVHELLESTDPEKVGMYTIEEDEPRLIGQLFNVGFNHQKQTAMKNLQGNFETLTENEKEQVCKMARRGHSIARIYAEALDTHGEDLRVRFSVVGNFTICELARWNTDVLRKSTMPIIGMVSGASKRHPEDDPNPEIGEQIALARAVKGDFIR